MSSSPNLIRFGEQQTTYEGTVAAKTGLAHALSPDQGEETRMSDVTL